MILPKLISFFLLNSFCRYVNTESQLYKYIVHLFDTGTFKTYVIDKIDSTNKIRMQ